MKIALFLLGFTACVIDLFGNTNLRTWTMSDGTKLRAELIEVDPSGNFVYLRKNERDPQFYRLSDFSTVDQAWLVEWLEVSERLNAKLDDLSGRFSHYNYIGDLFNYDFYIYEPSTVYESQGGPLMILFSPGPKGLRYLLRHLDAAESTGMTIVTLDHFGNTHSHEESMASTERFKEILPKIEEIVQNDPNQLFIGGTSGGALRAIRTTIRIDRPWAGIYSNGGWLGTERYFESSYLPIKVAMVNGNNDKGANYYLDRDVSILQENKAKVAVISFEGAHQVPPTISQEKAFNWLLGSEDITELSPQKFGFEESIFSGTELK